MSEYQKAFDDFKASITNAPNVVVEDAPSQDQSFSDTDVPQEQVEEDQIEQQEAAPRQKKKHNNTFKKRIDELTYHNYTKEQLLHDKEQENAYLRHKLQEKEEEVAQKEQFASMHYEGNLKSREIALMNELIAAKEEGNYQKEVELEAALFDVKAQKHTNDLYKSQIQPHQQQDKANYENYQKPYSQQIQQVDPYLEQQSINEDYEEWIEENSWANPNDPDNFDPTLRSEAEEISQELEKMLKLTNRSKLIGTKEFYQSIDRVMKERYGLDNQQQQEYEPEEQNTYVQPSAPASYRVAPVTRGGQSMADQYTNQRNYRNQPQKNISTINDQEYQIARNLQIPNGPKGSYIKDENDRLKIYNKMKNYPASPFPGGSPYRLTII